MALIDTTMGANAFPSAYRRRRPRLPSGQPQGPTLTEFADAQGQSGPALHPPGTSPPAISVNPMPDPMPQPGTGTPAPSSGPKTPDGDGIPNLLSSLGDVLRTRLTSTVDKDPRYLSQFADLQNTQKLRREQRKRDLTDLGIIPGSDGEAFQAFDTLGEQDIREAQNIRANVESLRSQDLTTALAATAEERAQTNDAIARAVAQGDATGDYVDPQTGKSFDTLTKISQDRGYALSKAGLAGELEEPEAGATPTLTGSLGVAAATPRRPKLTLAGRAQSLSEEVERGRLELAGREISETERRNLATESLQARGIAVDEGSLAEEITRNRNIEALQARGIAVNEGSLKEETRRNLATEALTARGIAVNENTLAEEIRRSRVQENLESAKVFGGGLTLPDGRGLEIRNGRDAYDMSGNYVGRYDTKDGKLTLADGRTLDVRKSTLAAQAQAEEATHNRATEALQSRGLTEEARRNLATEALQARGVTVTERSLNEEVRQNNIKELQVARSMGEEERRNLVTQDLTKRGQDIDNARINAEIRQQDRRLSQQEQEMYGGTTAKNEDGSLTFHPTMAYKDMNDRKKLGYAQLAEETRSNKAREDAAWEERTGISVGVPGTIAFSDFSKDMGKTEGFDLRNDFNNDGKVDHDDFFIGSESGKIVKDNATMTTVQRTQVDQQIKESAAAIQMDEKEFGLKSKAFFDSVSQWKSNFSGFMMDADGNPTGREIEEPIYETRQVQTGGGGGYLNEGNGTGTLPDGRSFNVMSNNDIYSGGTHVGSVQRDPATGKWMHITPEGQSIMFGDPVLEFRQVQAGTRKRVEPITSIQRQQFNEERRQFDAQLAENIRQFEKEIGFTMDKWSAERKTAFWGRIGNVIKTAINIPLAYSGKGTV